MIRARYYRNVINPGTGYAQGRYADGSFLSDTGNAFSFTRFITEGAPCHYTWYAPHDVYGLMECMGGKENTSPNWTPCSANTATGTATNLATR